MSTDRLQLILIPDPSERAQPLPRDVRNVAIELMARMLLWVVRPERVAGDATEGGDESR